MISPYWRQLIIREGDDLGFRDHTNHALKGCKLNGLGHMSDLEHAEKSFSVLRECMDEVPNGDVSLDFFELGSDISCRLVFFGGGRG